MWGEFSFWAGLPIAIGFNSYLDDLSGVGPKTKELLLSKFKSVKRIKESRVEEFVSLLGEKKGKKIFNLIDK